MQGSIQFGVQIVDGESLRESTSAPYMMLLVAVFYGSVRLIDNIELTLPP